MFSYTNNDYIRVQTTNWKGTEMKAKAVSALLALMLAMPTLPVLAQTKIADAAALARYRTAERIGQQRLATFDTLDFDVYTDQKWDRLKESHAANILVHYPDGHTTRGIPDHVAELKQTFQIAPDTRIRTHPVRIVSGLGEWTSVIGVLEGTFTKPIPGPSGSAMPATGKAFKIQMVTVGHWTKAGVMDEEYLFYDNAAFAKQIGLSQ